MRVIALRNESVLSVNATSVTSLAAGATTTLTFAWPTGVVETDYIGGISMEGMADGLIVSGYGMQTGSGNLLVEIKNTSGSPITDSFTLRVEYLKRVSNALQY
jgi:hypothetical protein